MKGKLLTIGFSTVLASILIFSIVYASWSDLGTGYAVTSNIVDGKAVAGNPVIVIAGTLDSSVEEITFRWFAPPNGSGECLLDETVPVYTDGTMGQWSNGTEAEIRYAQSTYKVYKGEWKVEVTFHSSIGETIAEKTFRIDVEDSGLMPTDTGTTIFYTPELPVGAIGATAAMVAALGLFAIIRKRQQK